MHTTSSWRTTYAMLLSLMLPMMTVVLMVYYFAKLKPKLVEVELPNAWALDVVISLGGVCAGLSVVLAISILILYRQRNRFRHLHRRQNTYLNSMLEERMRMTRSLDVLGAVHQVTLAIKQETSFERIASVVLEQIDFFARAEDVVVFAETTAVELEPRARRYNGINTYGTGIDQEHLEFEIAYESMLRVQVSRRWDKATGDYSIALPYATPEGIRGVVLIRRNTLDDPDFQTEIEQFESALVQLVKGVSAGLKFSAVWDRAIKDEMTGLFNKNHFNKEMPKLLSTAIKSARPFSMIMMDIDKFKHINDTFGHLPGDQILRQVSAIIIESLRESDLAFRYGGEELCVICRDTVGESAGAFAERLRTIIAHTEFRTDAGALIPVSASFGVAEYDPATMPTDTELKLACDASLYYGKEHGRNQVVVFEALDKFNPLERSGDVATEVKRRLGLAGDNTPLEDARSEEERRSAPKSGKLGKARQQKKTKTESAEPAKGTHEATLDAGRSIRMLAEQIIAAADDDKERLAEVARIAEYAAVAIQESRHSQRQPDQSNDEVDTPDQETPAPVVRKKATRKKAVRKKAATKRVTKPATEKSDSDRLDYLTDIEGEELLEGKVPKKSARHEGIDADGSGASTSAGWTPKKHW